jgi:hypothetical protein
MIVRLMDPHVVTRHAKALEMIMRREFAGNHVPAHNQQQKKRYQPICDPAIHQD